MWQVHREAWWVPPTASDELKERRRPMRSPLMLACVVFCLLAECTLVQGMRLRTAGAAVAEATRPAQAGVPGGEPDKAALVEDILALLEIEAQAPCSDEYPSRNTPEKKGERVSLCVYPNRGPLALDVVQVRLQGSRQLGCARSPSHAVPDRRRAVAARGGAGCCQRPPIRGPTAHRSRRGAGHSARRDGPETRLGSRHRDDAHQRRSENRHRGESGAE